jgi:hypothetical protein
MRRFGDVRYSQSGFRRPGFTAADRRAFLQKAFADMHLQPGDRVRYDFGFGRRLDLTVQSIDPTWVVATDETGRLYRFTGEKFPTPGIWEGDSAQVSAQLRKPGEADD